MKTISTAYYEKMAEAKQTFCAFCMRGAMPFLEDCKDCKINRMFKAVQAVIKEETHHRMKLRLRRPGMPTMGLTFQKR